MPGTLTISTLSDGTNSTSATNCIQGSAKAWVNFDGTGSFTVNPNATVIRASFNVSSITRNGAGDYTVNFTNAFSDNKYTLALSAQRADAYLVNLQVAGGTWATYALTTSVRVVCYNYNGPAINFDMDAVLVTVFR